MLACLIVIVTTLCVTFQWNWLREPLERYLTEKSQRAVTIAHFDVSMSWKLEPTFILRGVRVDNPPWADRPLFVDAGELRFTCQLHSLFDHYPNITRLVLIDANIDLERQADGLRNWRLTRPDDRGPGVVSVWSIEPVRTRIRFAHHGADLDVQLESQPLQDAADARGESVFVREAVKDDAVALAQRVSFEGTYRGASFQGQLLSGSVITFQNTARLFPLEGHATSAHLRLDLAGSVADLMQHSRGAGRFTLSGSTLKEMGAFLHRGVPSTPEFHVTGDIFMDERAVGVRNMKAKIGGSDAAGTITWRDAEKPHHLEANITRGLMDLDAFMGARDRAPSTLATKSTRLRASSSNAPPASKGEPGSGASPPSTGEQEAGMRADGELSITRISSSKFPAIEDGHLSAHMHDRLLEVGPISARVANGRLDASMAFDQTHAPSALQVRTKLQDLLISELSPDTTKGRIDGYLNAHVDLSTSGMDSLDLLRNVRGAATAEIRQGRVSKRLAAELALNGVQLLGSVVSGNEMVPIHCAKARIDFRNGRGDATKFVIETDETRIVGTGFADLPGRSFHLQLTPTPLASTVLQLNKSIAIDRFSDHVVASLEQKRDAPSQSCSP